MVDDQFRSSIHDPPPHFLLPGIESAFDQPMQLCMQPGNRTWADHEFWCLTIHGTEVRFIIAFFTKRLLWYIDEPYMYPSETVVSRYKPCRSRMDLRRSFFPLLSKKETRNHLPCIRFITTKAARSKHCRLIKAAGSCFFGRF